jgi:hypothetical protein
MPTRFDAAREQHTFLGEVLPTSLTGSLSFEYLGFDLGNDLVGPVRRRGRPLEVLDRGIVIDDLWFRVRNRLGFGFRLRDRFGLHFRDRFGLRLCDRLRLRFDLGFDFGHRFD